jgi:DNA-binding IclR family transcriptional regulator
MRRSDPLSQSPPLSQSQAAVAGSSPASQTLVRGLDVLEVVAGGPLALPALATRLGLARSTAHRLAAALLERRYLTLIPRQGYGLGPKLLELGSCAQQQTALVRVARPHMESLAAETLDSTHLSICDAGAALLLEQSPGRRRLLPALHIGERMKLSACAVGCALLLDGPEASWRDCFAQDCGTAASSAAFVESMRVFARLGYAYDPDDTADRIRTLAAPLRGAGGTIVAAIGLSTAALYLDSERLAEVGRDVARVAAAISDELGHPSSGFHSPNAAVLQNRAPKAVGPQFVDVNAEIESSQRAKPLEAEAQPVHDPRVNRAGRAKIRK